MSQNLVKLCLPYLKNTENKTPEYIEKVVALEQERLKKLSDIADLTEFFFTDKLEYPKELLAWKKMSVRDAQNNLQTLYAILLEVNEKKWQAKNLEKTLVKYIKSNDLKVGEYLWPLRVALTGRKASPGPFEVADILGKSTSLERIRQAIQD